MWSLELLAACLVPLGPRGSEVRSGEWASFSRVCRCGSKGCLQAFCGGDYVDLRTCLESFQNLSPHLAGAFLVCQVVARSQLTWRARSSY